MDTSQLILLVGSNIGSLIGLYQLLNKRLGNIERSQSATLTTIKHYDGRVTHLEQRDDEKDKVISELRIQVATLVEWKRNRENK